MTAAKKTAVKSGSKETIYVDVDDEITNIIDKVKASEHKIIALVLPKRASVLQSVVNMKLLKKAAVNAKKNIVLITSETGLLPLAGAAGIHVAKSLQSKPVIPPPPHSAGDDTEEAMSAEDDEAIDKTASVGALATAAATKDDDDTETIELDNMQVDDVPTAAVASKSKKLKHLKVPNFERFRLGFVLAGLGVLLLIFGWILAGIVLPKARITIKTDTTTVVSSFDFTASEDQPELDVNDKKMPATLKEVKKTDSEKVAATGERDDGTKASGEVTLSVECSPDNFGMTIPTGTAVSTGGMSFIMQQSAVLNNLGPGCTLVDTVEVLAAENGDKFNIGGNQSFSVAGYSSVDASNDSAFTGGTSKKVKIVSQKDIDDAVAKITQRQDGSASDELKATLEAENLYALTETLKTSEPKTKAEPAVNKEAEEVTVTIETTYSMLGIKREDLAQIIAKDIEDEIDPEKQSITNDGIDTAIMRVNTNNKPGEAFMNFRTSVTAGPEIDEQAIKEAVRGKKRGEVEQYISNLPGINEVVVDYSPFWVYSTPKAAKKITIVIEKTDGQQAQDTNSNE